MLNWTFDRFGQNRCPARVEFHSPRLSARHPKIRRKSWLTLSLNAASSIYMPRCALFLQARLRAAQNVQNIGQPASLMAAARRAPTVASSGLSTVASARRRRARHTQTCQNPPRPPTAKKRAGLLRHVHRRPAGGAHRDDAPRGRRAQDGRELPLPLHGREGCRGRVPLFSNSVAQWIAYQTSNLGVAGSSPVGVVSPIARRPFSIRGRVGLSSMMNQKGVGFKPQSLRRRGFEPHRMHT